MLTVVGLATLTLTAVAAGTNAFRDGAVVEPFPLSDVTLTGDWKNKEYRNQEVLMSLNFSRWACHFTTAANLTACVAAEAGWITLVKQPNGSFTEEHGFIGAGNDFKSPAEVSISTCESVCASSAGCAAITFQDPNIGNESDTKVLCYWKKTAGGFTPQSHSNCIANGGEGMPTCSPLPGEMGLGGYYGHYQGHWLSSTAFLYNSTGNETIRAVAAANIETLSTVMDAWKRKYKFDGYLFPYDPIVWDKLLAGHGAYPYYSVPFYTLHKLMAGLLDQYLYAGNQQAFVLVTRMAMWVHGRVESVINGPGGMDLWQRVLGTEWGGMNDVLYNLYQHTGNETYLKTARHFNGYVFTARLAAGEDDLAELPFPHANFHLPEIVGNARAFELTGNKTDRAIVETFFNVLHTNHSYATGGSNSGECWQEPRDLGDFLDTQTEESCTQYNVLKVARRRFITSPEAATADFYERAIWNGILGNQNRDDNNVTSYIYMQPLGGANTKPWGKSDFGFPCCWGTLSESFAKLGDSIFFWQRSDGNMKPALYVNQFVSATVRLAGLADNVYVEQLSHFPVDPERTTTLTVRGQGTFAIMIRIPGWSSVTLNKITVNGEDVEPAAPGSYMRIERSWNNGDVIVVSCPLSLWTAPLNDYHPVHNATLAFMYGPLVLAGVHMQSDIWVPKGGTETAKRNPGYFIKRNSSTSLDFEAEAANGTKIEMIPLFHVMAEQYVVYFMTAGTKPAQPRVGYCPHSIHPGATYAHFHGHGRGVSWSVVDGKITHAPVRP